MFCTYVPFLLQYQFKQDSFVQHDNRKKECAYITHFSSFMEEANDKDSIMRQILAAEMNDS